MDVYQALLTPNLADSDPIMRYCTKKFLTMLVLYEIMEYSKAAVATQVEMTLDSETTTVSTTTTLPNVIHSSHRNVAKPETKLALGTAEVIREYSIKDDSKSPGSGNRTKPHFHFFKSRFEGPFFEEELKVENVTGRVGSTINLNCRVGYLGDKTVTWTQRHNQNINLLTVGRSTYSKDERFSLSFVYPNNHRLQISYATARDDGTYECQVVTHPPKIKRIYLKITAPQLKIMDESMREVQERHYRQGSSLILTCLATNLGPSDKENLDKTNFSWKMGVNILSNNSRMNSTIEADSATSVLTISSLEEKHTGNYTCFLSYLAEKSVFVHVLKGELPAAVQASGIQYKTVDARVLLTVVFLLCCLTVQ